MKKRLLNISAALAVALNARPAFADHPVPWEWKFQDAASPVAVRVQGMHNNILLPVIIFIVALVMVLLLLVIVKFNARANPVARPTPHNPVIEVVWTVLPALLLFCIMIPSVRLIFYTDRTTKPELTLKVTGYQWYWGYEYPDQGGISFLSNRIPDKEIDTGKGQIRMLSVDNPVYLPVDTNVQILVTAADVIHSFAIPAFALKQDGIPGRINENWVRITKPGVYYGECSQICGANHAYMPIEIHAVSKEDFARWVADQKKQASNDNDRAIKLADVKN